MVIGVLQVELNIPGSENLKDKRRVVLSLKTKLHNEHMVSVSETGTLDSIRTATLGIVLAATDVSFAQSVLGNILRKLKTHRDCVLSDSSVQFLTGVVPQDDTDWEDKLEDDQQLGEPNGGTNA